MWKDLEISSLCPSALGTTFLYHCAGGAGQLRCQNLKEGWNTSASLGYPQGQYLLCTGPRSSFCCSCCCTAAWLGYIWFSSLEKRSHGCWGTRSLKDWWKPHPRPPDLQMFCSSFPLTSVILFKIGWAQLVQETCHVSSSSWGNTDALFLKIQKHWIFFHYFTLSLFPKYQCLSQAPLSLVTASAWVPNSHLFVKFNNFLLYLWKQNHVIIFWMCLQTITISIFLQYTMQQTLIRWL